MNLFSFLTLITLAFSLIGCSKVAPKAINVANDNDQAVNNQPQPISLPELEKSYESSLKDILQPYWQTHEIAGIKDKVLALKAPVKYLDLHLNLVMALGSIEQGQANSDQVKINAGQAKIDKLPAQYPWLNPKN